MNRRTPTRVLPRKEREKRARQEEILTAARALFALKGYHDTTLEEIAHHAEFGKGTIYNYFSSKEELFYGIIDQLTAETVELALASIRSTNGSAREKLTAYATAMLNRVPRGCSTAHPARATSGKKEFLRKHRARPATRSK